MSKRINKANKRRQEQIQDRRFEKFMLNMIGKSPEYIEQRRKELDYLEQQEQKEQEVFENRKPDIPVIRNQPRRRKKRNSR